ncbi:dodecin [uncultured Jatrophihabitans sp.]|uniref:dodecin n=1 Tax=uncultured Jatrophihabitans sp. TaxID=1610747 RepID=UPI0035CA3FF9
MDATYRVTDLVGTSSNGIDDAIRSAVARASETLHHIDWFEVVTVRGRIHDGSVSQYQVEVKVGFRLDPTS